MTTLSPSDRLLVAALADRLIYDSETVFDPDDARALLALIPQGRTPWIEFDVRGKMSGGSTRGVSPGVGDVRLDDADRTFSYSSVQDRYTRAGQWKLIWTGRKNGQAIEIEQVMADPTTEGRAARLRFGRDGTPVGMDIQIDRSFRLFWSPVVIAIPGWRPWKTPA